MIEVGVSGNPDLPICIDYMKAMGIAGAESLHEKLGKAIEQAKQARTEQVAIDKAREAGKELASWAVSHNCRGAWTVAAADAAANAYAYCHVEAGLSPETVSRNASIHDSFLEGFRDARPSYLDKYLRHGID